MRLKGKTAVVTGASRGIGLAITKKFLLEGATVLICDLILERLKEAKNQLEGYGELFIKTANVTNRSEVDDLVSYGKSKLGKIDILVNNAGISKLKPFLDITNDEWEETLSVNLTGTFNCSQAFAKEMVMQNQGSIVNMSSSNGILGEAKLAHYNASKAGIKLLTKTMAIELAPYNIRVNNVCPGFIRTNLASEGGFTDKELEEYVNKIPLHRSGTVDEVANAFCFLASDEASFITGTELVVDGGQLCQE